MVLAASACSSKKKNGIPTPANVHNVSKKPANAQDMGKTSKASPPMAPAGAPSINTAQPGDTGDEEFEYQVDIDGDGTLDDVIEVVDDETGDDVIAASLHSQCDDGSALSAYYFEVTHADGSGQYGFYADDVCGEGASFYGCDFDASGNDTGCGDCTIPTDGTEFTCSSTDPVT
jgi:hypothetical protein